MSKDERNKRNREGRRAKKEKIRDMRSLEWLIVCEGEKTEPNYTHEQKHLQKVQAADFKIVSLQKDN